MRILGIDHIGIAVQSLSAAQSIWEDILGLECTGSETLAHQKVTTSFFPVGESEIELLESTEETGPIAQFIERRGEGLHHIAFRVDNIERAIEELKQQGVRLIDEKPRPGAGGTRIAFLHPKATAGVLIELCQHD